MSEDIGKSEDTARQQFLSAYQSDPPWDIGRPQQAIVDLADQIVGSILDAGCGTGDNALFFVERGHQVLGIDFVEAPILQAKQKAARRGIPAEFLCLDILELTTFTRSFDNVIDCGLFHVLSDADRPTYVDGLLHVTKPDGKVFVLCFSDQEPGAHGPRRVSQTELRAAFDQGWAIESISASRFEAKEDSTDGQFSDGGPKAWLAIIRRDS
jgi:cyclopropane fatty-acyl-phospholipid synthase-like methyltransferase